MLRNRTSNIKKWSETDIENALTLKCISPKAYRYIKKVTEDTVTCNFHFKQAH